MRSIIDQIKTFAVQLSTLLELVKTYLLLPHTRCRESVWKIEIFRSTSKPIKATSWRVHRSTRARRSQIRFHPWKSETSREFPSTCTFPNCLFHELTESCRWRRQTNKFHSREFFHNAKIVETFPLRRAKVRSEIKPRPLSPWWSCSNAGCDVCCHDSTRVQARIEDQHTYVSLKLSSPISLITSSKVQPNFPEVRWRAWTAFTRRAARSSRHWTVAKAISATVTVLQAWFQSSARSSSGSSQLACCAWNSCRIKSASPITRSL